MVEHLGGDGRETLASIGNFYVQVPKPFLDIPRLFREPVDHDDALSIIALSQSIDQTFQPNLVL